MAKNKLLTIPISLARREELNQYCQSHGIKVSELITAYIDKCLSGIIDIEPTIDKPIDDDYQTLSKMYLDLEEFTQININAIAARLDSIEQAQQQHVTDIEVPLYKPAQLIVTDQSGISHAKLAKLLGKSPFTPCRWASGQRRTPDDVAAAWKFEDGKWYPI